VLVLSEEAGVQAQPRISCLEAGCLVVWSDEERQAFINFIAANPVPEPGTYGLMAMGLAMLGAALRQRRQALA